MYITFDFLTVEEATLHYMSFLNIKDPEERDEMMEDYLALKKRLKEKMEERGYLMDRQRDMEKLSNR